MLLKRIIIHNIASIADADINFCCEPLSDSSIFLITGETGAGKSTILDSICLALYDKTPRMTSISKEDINLPGDKENKTYTNDNSQLLRRGTGEGWIKLFFEGNDNLEYEAAWYVQRNHKKPDKKLQKSTRLLTAINGTYNETNKKIIPDKIKEITGLDYDQFCRTVMLAQGEFTKFLKSDKAEKSVILERLTGTDIYSAIGKMIANEYLEKKSDWEVLNSEIKSIKIMSDVEINDYKSKIDNFNQEGERLLASQKDIDVKINWYKEYDGCNNLLKISENTILNLEKLLNSEKFLEEKALISDYNSTASIFPFLDERDNCKTLVKKKEKLLPELIKNLSALEDERKEYEKRLLSKKEELTKAEEISKKFDISEINTTLQNCNDRFNSLSEIENLSIGLNNIDSMISEKKKEAIEKEEFVKVTKKEKDVLEITISSTQQKYEEISEDLEKVELASSNFVKELRRALQPGDSCPVCGNVVSEKLTDRNTDSILAPLRKRKLETEKLITELRSQYIAKEKIIKEILSQLQKSNSQITDLEKSREKQYILFTEKLQIIGCKNMDLTEIIRKINIEKDNLNVKIKLLTSNQKEANILIDRIKTIQKAIDKLQSVIIKQNENHANAKLAVSELQIEISSLNKRFNECINSIDSFIAGREDMSIDKIERLRHINADHIKELERNHSEKSELLVKERGAYATIKGQLDNILRNKPRMHEDDSIEKLIENKDTIIREYRSVQVEVGKIHEKIEKDRETRKQVKTKLAEEEKLRNEKEKWEGLYKLLGDTEGSKFRNVAQSFILKTLLNNANYYMNQFTDRYELTCNPGSLAILVKDCYRHSTPQPASILSGGESFMASLSLALALSNLRSVGNSVDILFIDEGFGTLSPDYLERVMDTLEKLHRIGGRRVGLISHVPELKERIPIQIQVSRESPVLSSVQVVSNIAGQ